jgi:curved DNA-binding protein CbpA
MWTTAQPGANASGPQQTETSTRELKMSLDHQSGEIYGEVLSGRHEGRALADLSAVEIKELYLALRDTESRRLLEAYAARYHPDVLGASSGDSNGVSREMTRERALKVLGLSGNATQDEIVVAHRRLIQRMHPDRGGSSYLAAELNAAKKFLIEE